MPGSWGRCHLRVSPGEGSGIKGSAPCAPCRVLTPSLPIAQKCMDQHITSTEESDPWWKAFSGVCRDM